MNKLKLFPIRRPIVGQFIMLFIAYQYRKEHKSCFKAQIGLTWKNGVKQGSWLASNLHVMSCQLKISGRGIKVFREYIKEYVMADLQS